MYTDVHIDCTGICYITLSVGEGCILMRDVVVGGCFVVLTASDRDEKVTRISDDIVFSYVLVDMYVSVTTEVLTLATEGLILLVREELKVFVIDGLIADREGLEVISANEEESVPRREFGERVNKTISSRNIIPSITPAIN